MLDHVRWMRRSARVGVTGASLYLRYKRTQRRMRGLKPEEAEAAWDAQHEHAAERLYQTAVSLMGLYIKVGQFAGTRADIFPPQYIRSLSRLQDRVPRRPVAEVRQTIEHEFGRPVDEIFSRFDPTPIATASLAQVHRATLPDGREVVVKVQHPEVASLVRLDLRTLGTMVGILARREPNFDYRAVVDEIGAQVPLELDFEREARLTRQIGENLKEVRDLVFPEVVDELVTRKVLATRYIEGTPLNKPERIADLCRDREALARTIAWAYGHQIMLDGLFQADPHPGNLFLLPDGRVALLDFGLTKELPDEIRLGFARLVMAAAERDPGAVVAAFRELGVKSKSEDPSEVLSLMRLFFDPRPIDGGGRAIVKQRDTLRSNPVEAIPGDLVLLGRVVGLLRGVCAQLGVALSPMQMLRPYAERALAEAERADEAPAAG